MKKILSFLGTVSLIFAITAANASAVRILHTDRTSNEVYSDKLQNGDMSDWGVFIPGGNEWSLKDFEGGKALTSTFNVKWDYTVISPVIDEQYTKNCIVSADYVFTESHAFAGMMVRGSDEDTMYIITFGFNKNSPFVTMNKRLGQGQWNSTEVVPTKSVSITQNVPTNVVAVIDENNIKFSIDGVVVINYTDESDPILEGRVGFMNQYGNTQFKNFKVTAIPKGDKEETANQYTYKNYVSYTADEINDFSDALFDYYGWEEYGNKNLYFENNNLIILSNSEQPMRNGAVSYIKKPLADKPVEFAALGEGEEYAISFKNVEKYQLSSAESDGYLLRVRKNELILEKWLKGKCVEIAKAEGGFMSKEEYKEFKIDLREENGKLAITVYSGGEEVIKAEDSVNPILTEGYVSVISYINELKLKAPSAKTLTEKQILGNTACAKIDSDKMYVGKFASGTKVYTSSAVMLPLRKLAAFFGAEVTWNEKDKACEMSYAGNEYKIMSGYSDYFINGERRYIKATIENTDGTIYVPTDFFENEFDKKVDVTDLGLVFISDKDCDISGILENSEILEDLNNKLK